MSISTKTVYLVASGDSRTISNQQGWSAQLEMEDRLSQVLTQQGRTVKRAHPYDPDKQHGFIDSQRMGVEVFKTIPADAPLIVAESIWQYSHHVLAGLFTHQGPILTVANWSGTWPGLVGMLNLNGSLTKAGVAYSTLWSEQFNDDFFVNALSEWLSTGTIQHNQEHVHRFESVRIPEQEKQQGKDFARRWLAQKAIMGVFDEGCMGMFNAIIPDDLLHPTGVFKERLSQSSLYAAMQRIDEPEAQRVLEWLLERKMHFDWSDEPDGLTRAQTLEQCKMYVAATRMADAFGCDTIGIQYQLGLTELTVASDLAEGLLNNRNRPPVFSTDGKELYPGEALPHFNEVDECAGLDALLTYRLWRELGLEGENTLHDLRWGQTVAVDGEEQFVWVFLISGAAPPAHFIGGYQGASSERQPPVYFRKGGGSLKGVSKPGYIVWSRIYIREGALRCDLGVGEVVKLSAEETEWRWQETTPQWPIMHAVLKGVTRDQMMARHKANHIQVVYAPDEATAYRACRIKAAALDALNIDVYFCGNTDWEGD